MFKLYSLIPESYIKYSFYKTHAKTYCQTFTAENKRSPPISNCQMGCNRQGSLLKGKDNLMSSNQGLFFKCISAVKCNIKFVDDVFEHCDAKRDFIV